MTLTVASTLDSASCGHLASLTSLRGKAGQCESLEEFLQMAAQSVCLATMAVEAFLVYLGGEHELSVATSPGNAPVMEPLLRQCWSCHPPPCLRGGPFEVCGFYEAVRKSLVLLATASGVRDLEVVCLNDEDDNVVGLLGLLAPHGSGMGDGLRGVARFISGAIDSFQLFCETRQHLVRQSLMQDVVSGIFATRGSLDDKIHAFLFRLSLLRNVDACSLVLVEGSTAQTAGVFHLRGDASLPVAALLRETARRTAPSVMEGLEGAYPCCLTAPLMRQEKVIAVLMLWSRSRTSYGPQDVEFLASVSAHMAVDIENAWLYEQTRQQLDELSLVYRVSGVLRREKTQTALIRAIVEECVKAVQGSRGHFLRLDACRLVLAASWGDDEGGEIEVPLSDHGTASLQHIRYSEDPAAEFPALFSKPPLLALAAGMARLLEVPLFTDRGLLGILVIAHREKGDLDDSARRLLQTLTNVAENAIGRATALEETEARTREEAASRAKSEFLAVMSHELRTPLTCILGFSELLVEGVMGTLSDPQRDCFREVVQSSHHLLDLINDVLDLAKVEAGKVDLCYERFDVYELLREVMVVFGPLARRKGVALLLGGGEDEARAIAADKRRLKQVIYNLVGNAIKFTDEGGEVRLQVAISGTVAHFEVCDTGIGIEAEDQEGIFKPFSQARRPPGRTYEGTGLGLSLSRCLVELHRGAIWVNSVPGVGSTFHVVVPEGKEGVA